MAILRIVSKKNTKQLQNLASASNFLLANKPILLLFVYLIFFLLSPNLFADEAEGLMKKTNVKNGICLIVGSKNTNLANALAANSNLYVQLLQSQPDIAVAWGSIIANSNNPQREKYTVQ